MEFVARKISFQGEAGYMVSQVKDGETMVEQFVSDDGYEAFCEAIGMEPTLVEN